MKVVCISTDGSRDGQYQRISIDKVYNVRCIKETGAYGKKFNFFPPPSDKVYEIINDSNCIDTYPVENFKLIDEIRNEKLEKLGI